MSDTRIILDKLVPEIAETMGRAIGDVRDEMMANFHRVASVTPVVSGQEVGRVEVAQPTSTVTVQDSGGDSIAIS